jgi:hypothetical protein
LFGERFAADFSRPDPYRKIARNFRDLQTVPPEPVLAGQFFRF